MVTLLPPAAEIIYAIGAGDRLAGRSKWTRFPPRVASVPDVGDGMRPSVEAVLARRPDLVVMYAGGSNAAQRDQLQAAGIRVLWLRHDTLEQLDQNIRAIGQALGCPDRAAVLAESVRADLEAVAGAVGGVRSSMTVYWDAWAEPLYTIGRGSYLDSLMTMAGAQNVFGDLTLPSPVVSLEAIIDRDPDHIITTMPGYEELPYEEKRQRAVATLLRRPGWEAVPAVNRGAVIPVDGDLMGILGPRTPLAARALAQALHPGLELPESQTELVAPAGACPGRDPQ
ncbi:MAG: ABC transporter substrate-binding protein [Gemmatimonadetes bacterium]|nr:ABC transporter substrate-binding protein [Gemmatimonadota bacterium]